MPKQAQRHVQQEAAGATGQGQARQKNLELVRWQSISPSYRNCSMAGGEADGVAAVDGGRCDQS
jgi:hypothetical protein